ncbi:MAG: FmdB family transcriptional regulator [Actinomycetota bacterium]|nr:FmdB family transcriptional regulator [Actinomycetota bacterium]
MPIYEYACTACGERTEAKQSFDDPPLDRCPVCGGPLRKLYSPVGIVFKGSGFYSTDGRSSKSKSPGSEDGPKTDGKEKKEKKEKDGGGSGGETSSSPSPSSSGSSSSSDKKSS